MQLQFASLVHPMREAPHEFKQTAFHILVAISFGVVVFVLVGTTPERQVGLQTSMSFARCVISYPSLVLASSSNHILRKYLHQYGE